MSKIKQILRLCDNGSSKRSIAQQLRVSKNTVKKYVNWADSRPETYSGLLSKTDIELSKLYGESITPCENAKYVVLLEELPMISRELNGKHVTRHLLWIEYRRRHPEGYGYAQFCNHLKAYRKSNNLTMVMHHEMGDKLYIDFAGHTWTVYEGMLNEPAEKQLFVASLGYSNYSYVEAVDSQKVEDFVGALTRSLEYFGRVPKAIVPDNLKSAVIKSDRYEPELNKVLEDFANHYGTTILPARVVKPQDKSAAEQLVKHTYAKIKAPLRNQKYFSLTELNEAIMEKLEPYNAAAFQRRSGSRQSEFEKEKTQMSLLPEHRFEIHKYRRLTVQKNSHILLTEDNHYYSTPYAYLGKKVRVIYTKSTVSIYFNYELIAMHGRNARPYGYTTTSEHLPSYYQDYKDRSPEYYQKWAATQSEYTKTVIDKVLSSRQHPEQTYRTCEGIKQLSKIIDTDTLNKACKLACESKCYQYKFIKTIIKNGMTTQEYEYKSAPPIKQNHKNIRGPEYYQNQT